MAFLGRGVVYLYFAALVVLAVRVIWGALHQTPQSPAVATLARHPNMILRDAVRKVSADASLLMLSIGRDEPIACEMARRTSGRQDFPANIREAWDSQCAFKTMVREATNLVFQDIAQSQALPPVAFAFDAYVTLEEGWQTMGLFADIDTCSRMVEAALSLGIGVRTCHLWTPRF